MSEENKYWMKFAGIAYAGMGAENNFCGFFYGTQDEAREEAYQDAWQSFESYSGLHGIPLVSDDEEEIEAGEDSEGNEVVSVEGVEDLLDYYVEPVSQKQIDNHGAMDEFIKTICDHVGEDPQDVCKKYGVEYDG